MSAFGSQALDEEGSSPSFARPMAVERANRFGDPIAVLRKVYQGLGFPDRSTWVEHWFQDDIAATPTGSLSALQKRGRPRATECFNDALGRSDRHDGHLRGFSITAATYPVIRETVEFVGETVILLIDSAFALECPQLSALCVALRITCACSSSYCNPI